jgi:hypothetical protein
VAVIVRLSRFRTTRPAFDAALRAVTLPDLRRQPGILATFAGRQGPEEIGPRLLATLWSSEDAMRAGLGTEAGDTDDLADTTERRVDVLSATVVQLAPVPLPSGIVRLARARLRDIDVATYARLVADELLSMRASGRGPSDLVMATPGAGAFLMLSTWTDWSAVEAATGASVSEPLRTKRLAALEDFEVDHYELLTDLAPGEALTRA